MLTLNGKELLAIENIGLLFHLERTNISISVSGEFRIGHEGILLVSTEIDKSESSSQYSVFATLKDGPLYIKEVFNHFLPNPPDQLPDIAVEEMSFYYTSGTSAYKGHFILDTDHWPIYKDKVLLTEVAFFIDHPDPTNVVVKSEAHLEVYGHNIYLGGEYISDEGWTFSGGTDDDKSISLVGLTNHLLETFGTKLPDLVPDIQLKIFL